MKLVELLINQKLSVQLLWGEQKIEFFSEVVANDGNAIYVSPYFHGGKELEMNVIPGKGVICNLFTNDPVTNQRISWKNIELTTVNRDDKIVYCIKTNSFNTDAKDDDRRAHDRIVVQLKGRVYDDQSEEGVNILVHDISDVGISFYAPTSFTPKSHILVVEFSDNIDERDFDVRVECSISRMMSKAGNTFIGCKIKGENKDYQLYGFLRRLKEKNKRTRK